MSKILFFIATLLAFTLASEGPTTPTTAGPSITPGDNSKPAVLASGAAAEPVTHDELKIQKREANAPPAPVVHDLTFSTLKPSGEYSTKGSLDNPRPNNDGIACAQIYDPVCGSDGKTYSNECMLGLAAQQDPAIILRKKGEC